MSRLLLLTPSLLLLGLIANLAIFGIHVCTWKALEVSGQSHTTKYKIQQK